MHFKSLKSKIVKLMTSMLISNQLSTRESSTNVLSPVMSLEILTFQIDHNYWFFDYWFSHLERNRKVLLKKLHQSYNYEDKDADKI